MIAGYLVVFSTWEPFHGWDTYTVFVLPWELYRKHDRTKATPVRCKPLDSSRKHDAEHEAERPRQEPSGYG